jgi:hypothetical protein
LKVASWCRLGSEEFGGAAVLTRRLGSYLLAKDKLQIRADFHGAKRPVTASTPDYAATPDESG